MTDIETQLRDAMAAAVAGARPPADVMALVRSGHRRHKLRAAAASAAAVAVVLAAAAAVAAVRGRAQSPGWGRDNVRAGHSCGKFSARRRVAVASAAWLGSACRRRARLHRHSARVARQRTAHAGGPGGPVGDRDRAGSQRRELRPDRRAAQAARRRRTVRGDGVRQRRGAGGDGPAVHLPAAAPAAGSGPAGRPHGVLGSADSPPGVRS